MTASKHPENRFPSAKHPFPKIPLSEHTAGRTTLESYVHSKPSPWFFIYSCYKMLMCCGCILFSTEESLEEHLRSPYLHTSGTFLCTLCGVTFPSQSRLNRHYQDGFHLQPSLIPPPPKRPSPQQPARYRCTTCSREFMEKSELQTHVDQVLHMRELRCTECPRSFDTWQSFEQHRSTAHAPPEPVRNDPATPQNNPYPRQFYNQPSLNQQSSAVQAPGPSSRRIPVTLAPAPTPFPTQQVRHNYRGVSNQHRPAAYVPPHARGWNAPRQPVVPRGQQFTCHICNKSFLSENARDQHLVSNAHPEYVLSGGQRAPAVVYTCDECDRTFTDKDLLKLHAANHVKARLRGR